MVSTCTSQAAFALEYYGVSLALAAGISTVRPGPAAHLAPAGGTRQSPRADLHARLLPGLAPAPRLGAADLHRRRPARTPRPRRLRPPLPARPGQSLSPARPGRPPLPQLPRPPRPPRHPQPGPLRRHPRHHPDAHRAHQPPAPGIRPHRRPHPAHLEVARTPPAATGETPSSEPQLPAQPDVTSGYGIDGRGRHVGPGAPPAHPPRRLGWTTTGGCSLSKAP